MKKKTYKRLSERQLQIVRLVAVGFTDKEIGDQLGIAPSTVTNYFRIVLLKLHARNRCHVVFMCAGSPKLLY